MFTLIKNLTVREFVLNQLPVLAASLLIAELFYKFHSFVLESLAFLVTWFVMDFLADSIRRLIQERRLGSND